MHSTRIVPSTWEGFSGVQRDLWGAEHLHLLKSKLEKGLDTLKRVVMKWRKVELSASKIPFANPPWGRIESVVCFADNLPASGWTATCTEVAILGTLDFNLDSLNSLNSFSFA